MPEIGSDHLTDGYDELTAARIKASFPGMAHFAGTGPAGRTCRECQHWVKRGHTYWVTDDDDGDDAVAFEVKTSAPRRDKLTGELKPRRCGGFAELNRGDVTKSGVPHYARSCRHFVVEEKAPPVDRPERNTKGRAHHVYASDDGAGTAPASGQAVER